MLPPPNRFVYQKHIQTFFWADCDFYRQNKESILQWAEFYNCNVPSKLHGWIECPDDDVVAAFRITWGC
jgi:hypothetical protein